MDIGSVAQDAMQLYSAAHAAHPFLTGAATGVLTFSLADAVSQKIESGAVDLKKVAYSAKLGPFYGIGIEALVGSGELVGKYISEHPLAKAALGPNLIGPLTINPLFFINNSIGEKHGYSVKKLGSHYLSALTPTRNAGESRLQSLKRSGKEHILTHIPAKEYLVSVGISLTAWNGFHWLSYARFDEDLRTGATLGASLAYTLFLSMMSLKTRKTTAARDNFLD